MCKCLSSRYIAKLIAQALFIGFTYFNADNSQQGTQNQLLGVFMVWRPDVRAANHLLSDLDRLFSARAADHAQLRKSIYTPLSRLTQPDDGTISI
jgi:ABC-type multidrug transport system permease subunit